MKRYAVTYDGHTLHINMMGHHGRLMINANSKEKACAELLKQIEFEEVKE